MNNGFGLAALMLVSGLLARLQAKGDKRLLMDCEAFWAGVFNFALAADAGTRAHVLTRTRRIE